MFEVFVFIFRGYDFGFVAFRVGLGIGCGFCWGKIEGSSENFVFFNVKEELSFGRGAEFSELYGLG